VDAVVLKEIFVSISWAKPQETKRRARKTILLQTISVNSSLVIDTLNILCLFAYQKKLALCNLEGKILPSALLK
jgi:hypothetical protein